MTSTPQPGEMIPRKKAYERQELETRNMDTNELMGTVPIGNSSVKVTGIERRKNTVFVRQPINKAQIMLSTMAKRVASIAHAVLVKSVETMVDGHLTMAIVETDAGTFTGWAKFNPNDVRVHKCISKRRKKPYTVTTSKYDYETGQQIAIHKALKKAIMGNDLNL